MSGQYRTRIWSKLLSPSIQWELVENADSQGECAQGQTRSCRWEKKVFLRVCAGGYASGPGPERLPSFRGCRAGRDRWRTLLEEFNRQSRQALKVGKNLSLEVSLLQLIDSVPEAVVGFRPKAVAIMGEINPSPSSVLRNSSTSSRIVQ
jgi:hypothetical protein